jgi:hypothetical protein
MRATLQSASDRLHQLEKDNVDLARNFAELEKLREMVRQKQLRLRARSTVVATKLLQRSSWEAGKPSNVVRYPTEP